jgi:hypothetical protein
VLRLSAESLQVVLVLEPLQALEERRGAGLAEGSAGQAQEFIVELAGLGHPVLGAAFETASVGERDRHRARHPGVLRARLRHQPDAAAERADLRVAECGLVEGFGVARAPRCSASATQNGMLYWASIRSAGSRMLWRSTMRSVSVTVIVSSSGPLKPCAACRSRTALTAACAVAWLGWRFNTVVETRNSSPRPRVSSASSHFVQKTLRNPNWPSSTVRGARPLEAVGREAGGEHPRLRGPPEVQALDRPPVAAGEFEQSASERPGYAENSKRLCGNKPPHQAPQNVDQADPGILEGSRAAAGSRE